jgi:hypothetical protein
MNRARSWSLVAAVMLAAVGCGEAQSPSDGSEEVTCPSIACAAGTRLTFSFPFSSVEAHEATFEACRNDLCYMSKLDGASTDPVPGSAVGFRAPPLGTPTDDDFVEVTLTNDGGRGLSLELQWWPSDPRTLHDGDRYTFVMTAGRMRTVFLDEPAKYSEVSLGTPGTACFQQCLRLDDDRRGFGLPRAGDADTGP